MTRSAFHAPDGKPVNFIQLTHNCGLQLNLMDWGATWLSCRVPLPNGELREVLLGCEPKDYFRQRAWLGATVGRYANRIAHSQIEHKGHAFQLTPNQGEHQLHGGPEGFDRRRWTILAQESSAVTLGLHSPNGDQGFPGKLQAEVRFSLFDTGIDMEYYARVDAPCPICLTQHSYFNLDSMSSDVRRHQLHINAAHYTPVNAEMIPTGELAPVTGSSFDFRQSKTIGRDFLADAQQRLAGGYDHAWLLNPSCRDLKQAAAILESTDKKLVMHLFTTLPAMQFYCGNHLAGTPARDGETYRAHDGLALETQFLPDSPNHPEWPQSSCWLMPDEEYRHTTRLEFIPR